MSTTKSQVKHDVARPQFFGSIRTIKKGPNDGKMSSIPEAEPEDPDQTLQNVTAVVDDTPIRLQGYTNVNPVRESVSATGYQVSHATGETLVSFMIGPVRRAFAKHVRLKTYVMVFDKGIFVPPPKTYTQTERTKAILAQMERQQVAPLEYANDGSVPVIVALDKVLPPWIAVRADRTLYRHAVNQLIELVMNSYKPPPDCRLIVDMLDMSVAWPDSLEHWMTGESILLSDNAKQIVERTRAALRGGAQDDWRTITQKIARELAQTGDLMSVPYCIETDATGVTFKKFLLPNAANQCGEADIGVLFWLNALQSQLVGKTLNGERNSVAPIGDDLAEYYTAAQHAENQALHASTVQVGDALPHAERLRQARHALHDDPDLILQTDSALVRAKIALALPLLPSNPCREPNRVLVMSVDSDFLSLVPLWYARLCYDNSHSEQYCIDNAPLLAAGECKVKRLGWLQSHDDFCKGPMRKKRKKPDEADDSDDEDDDNAPIEAPNVPGAPVEYIAHEIYDVHRMYKEILRICGTAGADRKKRLESVASFAVFCGACGNDYIAGMFFVNRAHSFKSFVDIACTLVHFEPRLDSFVIVTDAYTNFVKGCYYHALNSARGEKNKPKKSVQATSYNEMAALVQAKYKTGVNYEKKHMPDREQRQLVQARLQWWIVYVSEAWRAIDRMLDEDKVGWPPGTTNIVV